MLHRKNILRRHVSSLIAKKSGIFHLNTGDSYRPVSVTLDIPGLIPTIRKYEEDITEMTTILEKLPVLKLTYEDDIEADPIVAYHKICQFLNVQPQNVAPNLVRINARPLSELIQNYREVFDTLSGTPYEWMLESDKSRTLYDITF